MTNKEKLKNSINNDFDKENNYQEIIKKIERKNIKIKNNIWKWSLIPITLIVIITGILFINLKSSTPSLKSEIHYINENGIKLYINNLDKVGVTKQDADIKEMFTNGINIPWPEVLIGMNIPEYLDKYYATAIYTRKDNSSEYDVLNCYVYNYSNKNNNNYDVNTNYSDTINDYKNIRIAFSNTNKPIRDYLFSDEEAQETIINNVNITIFKYNTIYFTEFSYKGYNFDIETNNISEQELANLLFSIIK